MIDDYTRFCLAHACAKSERDSQKYCPLADEIRKQNHGLITLDDCKRAWARKYGSAKNGNNNSED